MSAAWSSDSPCSTSLAGRHRGLDALRGLASLMVVVVHATMPYLLWPMPLLLWPTRDAHPCAVVDTISWSVQCCVMPTFFVLSGYFSAGLLARLSAAEFFRSRRQRLLVPLIFGIATILPFCFYIWLMGWVADGILPPHKLRTLKLTNELQEHTWGLAHLWYLEYLFVYSAALAAAAAWLRRRPGGWLAALCAKARSASPALAAGGLALSAAGVLWWDLAIVVGFQNTVAPVATKLIYFALYFSYGLWLHEHLSAQRPQSGGRWNTLRWLSAAAVFALLLPRIHLQQQGELAGIARVALAGLLAIYAWLMADGLVRAAWHWRPQADSLTGRTLHYLAQASLWMYLAHLPIVGLLQIDLANVPLPAFAKFALVTLTAVGVELLFYQFCVRHTWIGALLEGRPASKSGGQRENAGPGETLPARRAA
jgi:peptidoglycan/LPS O-acetylase OafA/YrhL